LERAKAKAKELGQDPDEVVKDEAKEEKSSGKK